MKRFAAALAAILIIVIVPFTASAEPEEDTEEQAKQELEQGTSEILDGLDLSELEKIYNESGLSEKISFNSLINDIAQNGLTQITAEKAVKTVLDAFRNAFTGGVAYMAEIVVLLLLSGLLKQLPQSEEGGAAKTAFFAGYIICATLAAAILAGSIFTAKNALDRLGEVINAITPVLIAVLTGIGSLSASAVMSPVLAGLTGTVFSMVKNIVFPAIIVSAILNLLTNISSTVKLAKLAELIDSGIKWFMGIIFTVFLGVGAIKGITGAAMDGVTFKTAKYTIDKTVPFIGGMFSDTLDTVMACGIIVKNAVGTAGLILLAFIMLYPLAALVINMFLFKGGAAVAEPFSDSSSVKMLEGMGKIAMLLFIVVMTCTAMAFILIALLMGAADMSFMMR